MVCRSWFQNCLLKLHLRKRLESAVFYFCVDWNGMTQTCRRCRSPLGESHLESNLACWVSIGGTPRWDQNPHRQEAAQYVKPQNTQSLSSPEMAESSMKLNKCCNWSSFARTKQIIESHLDSGVAIVNMKARGKQPHGWDLVRQIGQTHVLFKTEYWMVSSFWCSSRNPQNQRLLASKLRVAEGTPMSQCINCHADSELLAKPTDTAIWNVDERDRRYNL
jgi:hypothetical protein